MKKDFRSLEDAGARLSDLLEQQEVLPSTTPVALAPIMPNGIPVALVIAQRWNLPLHPIRVERTDAGVFVVNTAQLEGDLADHTVLVVDDGVETGTAAMAAGRALKSVAGIRLELAVPVCSRAARVALDSLYSRIVAPIQPMAPRALHWHFDTFDTISDREAEELFTRWQETH